MMAQRWVDMAVTGETFAARNGYLGVFLTLTVPGCFHVKTLKNGRAVPNPRYSGATPAEGQEWLLAKWAKVRAGIAYRGIAAYGLRMVEPHHDGTPHWHVLLWVRGEGAQKGVLALIRHYWLYDGIREPSEDEWRVQVAHLEKGLVYQVVDYLRANPVDDAWTRTWGIRPVVPFGGLGGLAAWGHAPCA